jgi:hypothetical protein
MPCHEMHPIQDLFLESVSFALQFDMHFYMHSYVEKKFILVKTGVTPIPDPNWEYGVAQADLHRLQPLLEIIRGLLQRGFMGEDLLRTF